MTTIPDLSDSCPPRPVIRRNGFGRTPWTCVTPGTFWRTYHYTWTNALACAAAWHLDRIARRPRTPEPPSEPPTPTL